MHNGKGRILQKRRCSGSEQLKEKKKGRELRASFHELSPVNTAKDLSSLLCTAALGSKSSWLNCYRFCWKKKPKTIFSSWLCSNIASYTVNTSASTEKKQQHAGRDNSSRTAPCSSLVPSLFSSCRQDCNQFSSWSSHSDHPRPK